MDPHQAVPLGPEGPFVVLPAGHRRLVDGATHLLVAQGEDGPGVGLGAEHGGVDLQAQELRHPARVGVGVIHQVLVHDRLVRDAEPRQHLQAGGALGFHHGADSLEGTGPREVAHVEVGEVDADRGVARVARDVHAACARQDGGHGGEPSPGVERLVHEPSLALHLGGACDGDVVLLEHGGVCGRNGSQAARPDARVHQRVAQGDDALAFADSCHLRMTVEHLLEERGAAARHAHDEGEPLHRRHARREPRAAPGKELALEVDVGGESAEVERRGLELLQVRGQVEGAAVLAAGVEVLHSLESGVAAHGVVTGRAGDGLEVRDGAFAIVLGAHARGHDAAADVAEPRAALLHQRAHLGALAGAVQDVRQEHLRIERVGGLAVDECTQPLGRLLAASEVMVHHGPRERDARIADDGLLCARERFLRHAQAVHADGAARHREPRVAVAGVAAQDLAGQVLGVQEVAAGEQAFQVGLGVIGRHEGGNARATALATCAAGPAGRGSCGCARCAPANSRHLRRNRCLCLHLPESVSCCDFPLGGDGIRAIA